MTSPHSTPLRTRLVAVITLLAVAACGGSKTDEVEDVAPPPKPKPVAKPAPKIAMTPKILFGQFMMALAQNDRVGIEKASMLDPKTLDLLMTEERAQIVSKGGAMLLQFNMKKEEVSETKAAMSALFRNTAGLDVMELELEMELKSAPDNWQVVGVKDRWFGASGRPAETMTVRLGEDRSAALRKETTSFAQIAEVEPAPVDWMPTTPESTRTTIREKLKIVYDRSNPKQGADAMYAIAAFGKDAIPGLLNELVAVDFRSGDGVKIGFDIDRILNLITGIEMGYDVTEQGRGLPPAQARQRAVRRWFGWWAANKDKPLIR